MIRVLLVLFLVYGLFKKVLLPAVETLHGATWSRFNLTSRLNLDQTLAGNFIDANSGGNRDIE